MKALKVLDANGNRVQVGDRVAWAVRQNRATVIRNATITDINYKEVRVGKLRAVTVIVSAETDSHAVASTQYTVEPGLKTATFSNIIKI